MKVELDPILKMSDLLLQPLFMVRLQQFVEYPLSKVLYRLWQFTLVCNLAGKNQCRRRYPIWQYGYPFLIYDCIQNKLLKTFFIQKKIFSLTYISLWDRNLPLYLKWYRYSEKMASIRDIIQYFWEWTTPVLILKVETQIALSLYSRMIIQLELSW